MRYQLTRDDITLTSKLRAFLTNHIDQLRISGYDDKTLIVPTPLRRKFEKAIAEQMEPDQFTQWLWVQSLAHN